MDRGSRAVGEGTRPFPKGSGGDCVLQALAERGIGYKYLPREQITNTALTGRTVAEFRINGKTYYFAAGALRVSDPHGVRVPGPPLDGPKARFLKKKDAAKAFLREYGLNVPRGAVFWHNARHEAEVFFAAFAPALPDGVCVKPADGHWGHLVHPGIRDMDSFRAAFAAVGEHYLRVLVEETVRGPVYRFNGLGGRVIAVEFQRPANVEGDGAHTITELIEIKNAERQRHPTHGTPLQLDEPQREFLSREGLRLDEIPEAGKVVPLSYLSNLHQGGEHSDATDAVHESYVKLIEHALKQLPDLVLCGVDTIIPDPSVPATRDNYYVLEINRCPGFSTSHYPWRGQPRDVAGAIIDYLSTHTPARPETYMPTRPGTHTPARPAPRRLGERIRQALRSHRLSGTFFKMR